MNYLDVINEGLIHQVFDAEMIEAVFAHLQAGKVVARVFYPPDELAAVWDNRPNAPQMGIRIEGDELMFRCTCRQFSRESMCEHIAALLVAWARERSTFTLIDDADEDEEGFWDEDDDEDIIYFDDGDFGRPIGAQPSAPSMPPRKLQAGTFDPVADYRNLLSELTLPELREIARIRGVPISGQRKDPILDSLAQALSRPEKLAEDWPKLSAQARLVAGLIPFTGPNMLPKQLQQSAQRMGLKGEKAFNEAVEELRRFGLINVTQYGMMRYPVVLPIWIPTDPDFVSLPVLDAGELRVQSAADPRAFYQSVVRLVIQLQSPEEQYKSFSDERERGLLKGLPFLIGWPLDLDGLELISRSPYPLQALRQKGVRMVPQPSLLAGEARMKLSHAAGMQPEQVDFVLRLLSATGMLTIKPGKPVSSQPDTLVQMVQAGPLNIARELFAYSAGLETWSELDFLLAHPKRFRFVINDHTGRQYSWLVSTLASLRNRALMLIRRLPPGRWYAVDQLAEKGDNLALGDAFTLFSGAGFFEIEGSKARVTEPGDQKKLLAAFLEGMLTGPLYWQGAVDLGWKDGKLAGFRISALGAALLAQARDYKMPEPPPGAPSLEFQADGGLKINLETINGELLLLLSQLGNVETTRQGDIVYRPTLHGAGRAFEAGWTNERILDALAQAAHQPAPEKLSGMLHRWWSNFGSVQMYQNVALIELGDDFALNELLAGTSLSRYLLYRFNARLVAILPEGVEPLREELVKKGYTPKFTT